MLSWFRQVAGVDAAPPPPKKVNPTIQRKLDAANKSEESHEVRLQLRVQTEEHKQRALQEEFEDLGREAEMLTLKAKDPTVPTLERKECIADATVKLRERAALKVEMQNNAKILHNLRGQLSVSKTASSNLDHALLLQRGAEELESTVAVMEQLNVEDSVDRLKDAAEDVHNYNNIFTQDMGLAGLEQDAFVIDEQVERELAALMEQQLEDEMEGLMSGMPKVPETRVLRPTQTGQTIMGEEKTI